jgi:DNA-binding transcriptional ArsR family regulator
VVARGPQLDAVFGALANPTRRAIVARLGRGPATVTELAAPFDMALPSFLQHVRVLEASGLVRTTKQGRVRTVEARPERLAKAAKWLEEQRSMWERRLDRLDAYLSTMDPDS